MIREQYWICVLTCFIQRMLTWTTLSQWSTTSSKPRTEFESIKMSKESLYFSVSKIKFDWIDYAIIKIIIILNILAFKGVYAVIFLFILTSPSFQRATVFL